MRLRFFVIDQHDRLHKAFRTAVEGMWTGQRSSSQWRFPLHHDLRIVTVVCDNDLTPQTVCFLRLGITEGQVTEAARQLAYQSIASNCKKEYDCPSLSYQLAGWPKDWKTQLAVAMDVPVQHLQRVAIGGPLPVSDLLGVSVNESLRYFEQIAD